jgi:hypothetical protein
MVGFLEFVREGGAGKVTLGVMFGCLMRSSGRDVSEQDFMVSGYEFSEAHQVG